jgi:vacuolar-type H+-ATPase subunit I/STV1
VGNISLQEFGIVGVFALAVIAVFKLYTESVKRQLADRDAELCQVRKEKDEQISDLKKSCAEWQMRTLELHAALHKSVDVARQLTDVAKGAVEIEKKAAQ